MPSPKEYFVERTITVRQVARVVAQTQKDALGLAKTGNFELLSAEKSVGQPRDWSIVK